MSVHELRRLSNVRTLWACRCRPYIYRLSDSYMHISVGRAEWQDRRKAPSWQSSMESRVSKVGMQRLSSWKWGHLDLLPSTSILQYVWSITSKWKKCRSWNRIYKLQWRQDLDVEHALKFMGYDEHVMSALCSTSIVLLSSHLQSC